MPAAANCAIHFLKKAQFVTVLGIIQPIMAAYSFRELFRTSSANERLSLFRALFDAQELNVDLALAMLKVIHKELGQEPAADRSAYKRYAETIETLRHHKRDMLREVVNAWKADRIVKDPDWLSDGRVK
jgi:hypothetical protein